MKKFLALALAVLMLIGLAACGGANNEQESKPSENGGGDSQPVNTDDGSKPAESDPAAANLTGKLSFIELDDRDSSVLRGVTLFGNRAGSAEFNEKSVSIENIRCIFELNEYVGAIPDTDAESGMEVYVLQHRDDQAYYETARFSEETPGFAALYRMERVEGDDWGEFYLNPEDAAPGYYDFVFVYEGKAIATLLTRFYNQGELEGKSDAELEALMLG